MILAILHESSVQLFTDDLSFSGYRGTLVRGKFYMTKVETRVTRRARVCVCVFVWSCQRRVAATSSCLIQDLDGGRAVDIL